MKSKDLITKKNLRNFMILTLNNKKNSIEHLEKNIISKKNRFKLNTAQTREIKKDFLEAIF